MWVKEYFQIKARQHLSAYCATQVSKARELEECYTRKDLLLTKLQRGPRISSKLSFRELFYSKLFGLRIFHISLSQMKYGKMRKVDYE